MKRLLTTTSGFSAFAVAMAICLGGMQANAASQSGGVMRDGVARVAAIKGDARFHTGNQVWQTLRVGTEVGPGAVIQTAGNSRVDLVFNEPEVVPVEPEIGEFNYYGRGMGGGAGVSRAASVVRVNADSVLAIDRLALAETGVEEVSETQLDLRAGTIMFNVKKLSASSKYEIKFPNGVAGIRGTAGLLKSLGLLQCYLGSMIIAFVNPAGSVITHVVNGGQQFDPATGEVTGIPVGEDQSAEARALGRGYPSGPRVRSPDPNDKPTSGKLGGKAPAGGSSSGGSSEGEVL